MSYTPTIGLEIHAELKTRTKMFCSCKNDPDEERPNWNVCPVCTAQPGTLPVINKEAVRHVLRVGAAVKGGRPDFTEFDRKNYFYPDIPKGYQISQYKFPLVDGGEIAGVLLTRVHLEEDTASSRHDVGDYTLVDFNRSGVPLMELVTEPVIHDAETAVRFAKELQMLLRYLGASDANMEKGEMRVEANVSVSKTKEFGTKVEVKNLNSFKSVGDAIVHEVKRQIDVLEKGGKVVQETRGWDENTGKTFSQRKKETAHDYRYFPEPDLPKLLLSEITEFADLAKALPELPWERRAKLLKEFSLSSAVADAYVVDRPLGDFFLRVALLLKDAELVRLASNYIASDLVSLMKTAPDAGFGHVEEAPFAELIRMVNDGTLSSRGAKDTLAKMFREGGLPGAIAEKEGLLQKSDPAALTALCKDVIAAHPAVVEEYKGGKVPALQFLVGQAMKASKGAANPTVLAEMFKKLL